MTMGRPCSSFRSRPATALSTATKPEELALLKRSGWIDCLIEEIETIGPEPLQGFRVSPQLFFIKHPEKEPHAQSPEECFAPLHHACRQSFGCYSRAAEKIDRHCGVP